MISAPPINHTTHARLIVQRAEIRKNRILWEKRTKSCARVHCLMVSGWSPVVSTWDTGGRGESRARLYQNDVSRRQSDVFSRRHVFLIPQIRKILELQCVKGTGGGSRAPVSERSPESNTPIFCVLITLPQHLCNTKSPRVSNFSS